MTLVLDTVSTAGRAAGTENAMKETFDDIRSLFNYYYYLKLRHESAPVHSLGPELVDMPRNTNPEQVRSRGEEEKAFIGDVGLFLADLMWWEREILLSRFSAPGTKSLSYTVIARKIRTRSVREGMAFPSSMGYRSNVCTRFRRLTKEARDYFTRRGYLNVGWRPKEE